MTTSSARQAATAHLHQAEQAIHTMFDRHDDVVATLTRLHEITGSDTNVFSRTSQLVEGTQTLSDQLDALRAAAVEASEYRSRRDLARDLQTSPNVLFTQPITPPAKHTEDAVDATSVA